MAPSGDAGPQTARHDAEHADRPSVPPHRMPMNCLAPRPDLYRAIHKALRHGMAQSLWRLGRLDLEDEVELQATLDGIESMLDRLRHHLRIENEVLHTAIEARRPGATLRAGEEHHARLDALTDLGDEVRALRRACPRREPAARLYRHLAAFIGESLLHMQAEECDHNAWLWALYDDAELWHLQQELLARICPAELLSTLHWLAASLSVTELGDLFHGLATQLAPEDRRHLLERAREPLGEARWAQLAQAVRAS